VLGDDVGRIRTRQNRHLERYVRVNQAGYVTYKHPRMDHYESFGKDVIAANDMARIINAKLSGEANRISRAIQGRNRLPLFSEVIDKFITERPAALGWSASTLKQHIYKLDQMREYGGDRVYEDTDVLFFSKMVDYLFSGTTRRPAISLCRQLDAFAMGKGMRLGLNVGDRILDPAREPRKRQRIKNYEQYLQIRECAEPWLQDAMDLALISLQPRQVLCSIHLGMIKGNKLRVWREKTDTHIEIEIGESLKSVIARRRVEAVRLGTRKLICRAPLHGNNVDVLPSMLTWSFTQAVTASGLYQSNPPTLHELRSLGSRMYELRGFDKGVIQNLMGHKQEATTDIYLDPDEPKHIKSEAFLEI